MLAQSALVSASSDSRKSETMYTGVLPKRPISMSTDECLLVRAGLVAATTFRFRVREIRAHHGSGRLDANGHGEHGERVGAKDERPCVSRLKNLQNRPDQQHGSKTIRDDGEKMQSKRRKAQSTNPRAWRDGGLHAEHSLQSKMRTENEIRNPSSSTRESENAIGVRQNEVNLRQSQIHPRQWQRNKRSARMIRK